MGIITNAISSVLGLRSSPDWNWRDYIQPASFRGVPFGVISGDGTFGRRVAVHEYPFRDTVYVEDLGRSTRKFTIRGFLVHESLVYDAPDVFTQRNSLIAASELAGSATLVHPTLGELAVYVPDGGLQVTEGMESERVFEFTLTCIEAGEREFSMQTGSFESARQSWYKSLNTIAARYIAIATREINSVAFVIESVSGTTGAFNGQVQNAIDAVTNLGSVLQSTFGNNSYSRYNNGDVGGRVTGSGVVSTEPDARNVDALVDQKIAESVTDRNAITESIKGAGDFDSIEDIPQKEQVIIENVADSTGSTKEKIEVFETLSNFSDTGCRKNETIDKLVRATEAMLVSMAASSMVYMALQYTPSNLNEAQSILERVCTVLDRALLLCANLGDDECYRMLMDQRIMFVQTYMERFADLSALMRVKTASPLPALLLSNRLYQNAARSSELVQAANPVHPAFMPIEFDARKD